MGLLSGLFNGLGLRYAVFEKWVDQTLASPIPDKVVAFCFNLYEDTDGWSTEIIGAPSFDKNDSDWACDEIFDNRINCLRWKNTKTWEQNLDLIKSYIERYLSQGKYANILIGKHGVGVGFVNGDLYLITIPVVMQRGDSFVVEGIPDEIKNIVIYTQGSHATSQYYPYVTRFEDKNHYPISPLPHSLEELRKSIKRVPVETLSFEGFELDSTGISDNDPVVQQALKKVQSLPGHFYGQTDTPVYYFKRVD